LALFLLIRVIKSGGKDTRFDDKRKSPAAMAAFYIFQILWVWIVSLPVTLLNSPAASDPSQGGGNPPFGGRDIAGIIMWSIGFICETIADFHKFYWRFSKPPKSQFMHYGLWKFSRAPNYFGEILLWWGIFVICNSVAVSDIITNENVKKALWASILSPIFSMLILLGLSGLPLTQKPTGKKFYLMSNGLNADQRAIQDPEVKSAWSRYKEYVKETSILIPFPNFIYRRFPEVLRWIFLDFPIYRFNEEKEGPKALQEEEQKAKDESETRTMVA
jgi:protein-S-isoprenylcysteine O-methyltransferase Ste14